jgi:hypothetical protein
VETTDELVFSLGGHKFLPVGSKPDEFISRFKWNRWSLRGRAEGVYIQLNQVPDVQLVANLIRHSSLKSEHRAIGTPDHLADFAKLVIAG